MKIEKLSEILDSLYRTNKKGLALELLKEELVSKDILINEMKEIDDLELCGEEIITEDDQKITDIYELLKEEGLEPINDDDLFGEIDIEDIENLTSD